MKNTKFIFYITGVAYGQIEKVALECVMPGTFFNNNSEAQEWISDNISKIQDIVDYNTIYDHIVGSYKPTNDETYSPRIVKRISGKIIFDDKLKELKAAKKLVDDTKAAIKSTVKKVKIVDNKVRKIYDSCWIEPNGNVHKVGFGLHNDFACDYLEETETEEYFDNILMDYQSYTGVLEERGWVRILGWVDPPCFQLPDKITPKQKKAIQEYCQSNACNLPKEMTNE